MENNELIDKNLADLVSGIIKNKPEYRNNSTALVMNTWAIQAKRSNTDINQMSVYAFFKHVADNPDIFSSAFNILDTVSLLEIGHG